MSLREKSPLSSTAAGLGRFPLGGGGSGTLKQGLLSGSVNFLISYRLLLLGQFTMLGFLLLVVWWVFFCFVLFFNFVCLFAHQFIKLFARATEVNMKARLDKSSRQQISPFCPRQLMEGKSSFHC